MKPLPCLAIICSLTTLSIAVGACSRTERVATIASSPDFPRVSQAAAPSRISVPEVASTEAQEQNHIATFDDLDFNVFSNQKWDELSHSHAKDVIVHWPDGHVTKGIDVHIEDLKKLFVHAPDTRIKAHPHRIAQGNLTAVSGLMEGTFSKPMTGPNGEQISPTGKAFALPMATIGRWENGVMQEEWLYWDNQTYMRQMGLGK